MRGILDFYRSNPLVLVVAVVVGAVVSVSAAAGTSDGWIGDVVAVGVVGLLLGLFVAWNRKRRSGDEDLDGRTALPGDVDAT